MFRRIYKLQFISKIIRAFLTFFSMMLKNISFPLTVPRPTSNWGKDFSLQSPEFYMCPEEQQTSYNIIVKVYCFIIEIFDKFSFSGILRRCLRHFN